MRALQSKLCKADDKQRNDIDFYAGLVRRHGKLGSGIECKKLHLKIIDLGLDRGTFLGNLIVQMYGRVGELEQAFIAFENITEKNVFSWTLMFTAYAHKGHIQEARRVFDTMPIKDVVAWTAMLAAYSQLGLVERAREIFNKIPEKDVVAWNAMLAAYGQNKQYDLAIVLYRELLQVGMKPSSRTFVSILDVAAGLGDRIMGAIIHRNIFQSCGDQPETGVSTALVNMYGKCGDLELARELLDKMPEKDVVAYTAMLAAYSHNGQPKRALEIFLAVDLEGLKPDDLSFVSVLHACTDVSDFATGRLIHDSFRHSAFASAANVANTLVTFYGRAGNVMEARGIFDGMMGQRTVMSWNAMLDAYAQNGDVEATLELFPEMILEGVEPDEITFVVLLSACSHGGLVKQGCEHFASIAVDYRQAYAEDHLMCVIDLLGRVGQLDEAEHFLKSNAGTSTGWTTLLSSCKVHGDSKRAERAGEKVMQQMNVDCGPYMLLSDIFSQAKPP